MTRSSELRIDGNTGHDFLLEPFTECASTLKITVGHRCTCSGRTLRLKADNKKTELTRQTSAAVFHNFCLDDHLHPHDQLRRHVRFRPDQLCARRTSPSFPNLAHALFARFLGRRPVLLDRVFLRVCESKAAIPSYARSVAFMATAHTAHCHQRACATSLECFVHCAWFEGLTNVLKQYVSAGERRGSDNASAPVCSMTQVDIWPSMRENKEDVCRDPHAGGLLH